ncbi:MAG TPA: recombinase family protein, partial [Bellilinea sp.]|nr:recombinase family protein [Bellilinea sp.]
MSPKKKRPTPEQNNIALCYVRQSFTRDDDDKNSPERQRANIERVCQENNWVPEWYEDAEGHKSARKVQNRPGWLALEKRLGDEDVAALVANDLARLHRKGWRVGDLIERLERYNVALVLAAPNRHVDTSTPMGRIFIQFAAIFDEYYAEDISQRVKDNIQFRKSTGKSIGKPPFGTIRGDDGYLMPIRDGAWLLVNGKYQAGQADESPETGAIWRSYYECAGYILAIYAENRIGLENIAYQLNEEGWPFSDRQGNPRMVTRDDIRRVVGNWPEYGGMVMDLQSKSRPAYEPLEIDELPLREDRAVFPLELVRAVGRVRAERSFRPADKGVKREASQYTLSGIVFCAHCDKLMHEENEPGLRTRLTGRTDKNGIRRYKHKTGITCGVTNRSIPCDDIEEDFGRLIKLLTVNEQAIDLMSELAIQAENGGEFIEDEEEFERQKTTAIALCNRRIEAARFLFLDGEIDREDYLIRKEQNEREIAHWEARTTETQEIALELAICLDAIDKMARLWDIADDEDRKGMAQNLFEEVVVNLDTRRIESFRLKPWADRFLVLRMELYRDEYPEIAEEVEANLAENETPPADKGQGNHMPHRGRWLRGCLRRRRNRSRCCVGLTTRAAARSTAPWVVFGLVQRRPQNDELVG